MNKVFTLVWGGHLISLLGSSAASFALSLLVFQGTGQVSFLALVLGIHYFTSIYLAPVMGAVADYFPRRSLILICNLALGLIALVLAVVVINSIDQRIFLILILIAASGAVNACLTVTLAASVRQIRKEADLTRVNGLTSLIENLPVFAGPLLGAIVYTVASPSVIFLVDGITFFASAALVLLVVWEDKVEGSRSFRPFAGALSGIKWILARRDFRFLQINFAVNNFLVGLGTSVLTAYVVTSSSEADAQWNLALVSVSSAAGLLLGSGLVIIGANIINRRWLIGGGILVGSLLGRVLLALSISPFLWAVCSAVRNIGVQCTNAPLTAIWQERTPTSEQGSVFGARRLLGQGPFPLAVISGGLLADTIFTHDSSFFGLAKDMFPRFSEAGGPLALMIFCIALLEVFVGVTLLVSRSVKKLSLTPGE